MRKECKEKGFIIVTCLYDDEDGKRVSFSYTCEEGVRKARLQNLYLKFQDLLGIIILKLKNRVGANT